MKSLINPQAWRDRSEKEALECISTLAGVRINEAHRCGRCTEVVEVSFTSRTNEAIDATSANYFMGEPC